MDTVITVGGKGGGGGGDSSDDDNKVLAIQKVLLERMPEQFDRRKAHEASLTVTDEKMISLGVFLLQEMSRFNAMMVSMLGQLKMLDRAIKGLVVMSADLEAMYNNFLFNQVRSLKAAHLPFRSCF